MIQPVFELGATVYTDMLFGSQEVPMLVESVRKRCTVTGIYFEQTLKGLPFYRYKLAVNVAPIELGDCPSIIRKENDIFPEHKGATTNEQG